VLYPFEPGSAVHISIRQPDGSVFARQTVSARSLDVSADILNGGRINHFDYSVGGVSLTPPTAVGLAVGVWTVEASADGKTITRAYRLGADDSKPFLQGFCDGPRPGLNFANFPPSSPVTLVLAKITRTVEGTTSEEPMATDQIEEQYRWTPQVGPYGDLTAR